MKEQSIITTSSMSVYPGSKVQGEETYDSGKGSWSVTSIVNNVSEQKNVSEWNNVSEQNNESEQDQNEEYIQSPTQAHSSGKDNEMTTPCCNVQNSYSPVATLTLADESDAHALAS